MALQTQEPTLYDLVQTPDVGECVVRLWVPMQTLKQRVPQETITAGTTLAAFLAGVDKDNAELLGYDSYKLTNTAGSNGAGYLGYDFAKPKTAAELLVPYKTTTTWERKTWPPILRVLYAERGTVKDVSGGGAGTMRGDPAGNGSFVSAAAFHQKKELIIDRMEKIPGGEYWTKFEVKDYLSAVPFTNVVVESMVTSTVQYSFLGTQRELDCLHPDVTIPQMLENTQRVPHFGTANARELPQRYSQFFPKTKFTTWQPHLCKVDMPPDPVEGVYRLRTWKCFPPAPPRAVQL